LQGRWQLSASEEEEEEEEDEGGGVEEEEDLLLRGYRDEVNLLHYGMPLSGFICYRRTPLKWSDRMDFLNLTTLGGSV
jgi:hypothetical protein